jgi:hypothetical protein
MNKYVYRLAYPIQLDHQKVIFSFGGKSILPWFRSITHVLMARNDVFKHFKYRDPRRMVVVAC